MRRRKIFARTHFLTIFKFKLGPFKVELCRGSSDFRESHGFELIMSIHVAAQKIQRNKKLGGNHRVQTALITFAMEGFSFTNFHRWRRIKSCPHSPKKNCFKEPDFSDDLCPFNTQENERFMVSEFSLSIFK